MTAADTSVVVAAFASWHEDHFRAVQVLDSDPLLPVHVSIEVYSVLTRLPPPSRAPANVVNEFMQYHFSKRLISLPHRRYVQLLQLASTHNITGGAVYDALVAATTKHAGATLLTLDKRAVRTYDFVGVSYEMV